MSGPEQPISFSHKVHAEKLGMECLYCHSAAATSQHATVPAVSVCTGCHDWVKEALTDPDGNKRSPAEVEKSRAEIQKIHDFYDKGESIPWIRVHWVPEHVQFKHFKHVQQGIDCQRCHGAVETMNQVYLTPDTVYRWPDSLGLPAAKLEMGWCVDCHKKEGGWTDCAACHY